VTDGAPRPASSPRLPWRPAQVLAIVEETPRAKSLVLAVPGWPGHLAGQHVDLRLTAEDGYQAERSYSLASPPEQAELALTVERIDGGEVSPFLTAELQVGDELELRGPIGGHFVWTAGDDRPLQLCAGGSGMVPLMAMLRHRARRGSRVPARLITSSRTEEGILYRRELDELVRAGPGLSVVHTLTRTAPPGWPGRRGRIDGRLLRELAFAPDAGPRIYVCGPTPFVEAVATALVGEGHPPAQIKTERFGPTGP
jgi:ferredoxin-NADP reductase